MDKNKSLIKNTMILFIGKFCTQFLSFFLVPLYTHFLTPNDYGYIDLVQTYILLAVPIIMLRLDSGVFRFLIDERKEPNKQINTVSSTMFLILLQILIFSGIFLLITRYFDIQYAIFILINTLSMILSNILLQLARGLGDNIGYSISSVISGLITIIFNLILIIYLKINGCGILIASSLGNIACFIFLSIRLKIYNKIKINKVNKMQMQKMLKYSLPMIPDGLSWWIIGVSDRSIITFMINEFANGIYAVSSKFSNILFSIFQVFNMSWQESASLHINDDDKNTFFSSIINETYKIFFTICLVLLGFMPIVFEIFIGKSYMEAYKYVPILLLGNLFNSLANTIGGIYIAKKETSSVAKTTLYAAVLNLIIDLLLIKKIKIYAAAISTLLSYVFLAFYRYIDVKKYIDIKISKKFLCTSIMIYIFCTIIYYKNNFYLNILNLIVIIIISYIANKKIINKLLKKIGGKNK